jgi:hypothetical protein
LSVWLYGRQEHVASGKRHRRRDRRGDHRAGPCGPSAFGGDAHFHAGSCRACWTRSKSAVRCW